MALITTRDWVMLGMGFAVGYFVFTATGRRAVYAGAKYATAEAQRAIAKVEKKAEKSLFS